MKGLLANGSHNEKFYFAKPVLFYVANNDIDLSFPILGNPFLLQNAMIIQYNLNHCIVSAHLYNAAQIKMEVNLHVSYAKQEDIKFVNQTIIEGNKIQQYIFKSENVFFGTHHGILKNDNFDLPKESIFMSNAPKATFIKTNNIWIPVLQSKFCIKAKVHSIDNFDPGCLDLSFHSVLSNNSTSPRECQGHTSCLPREYL